MCVCTHTHTHTHTHTQIAGILMTSVWAAVGTTLIMFALKFTIGIRVSEEDEVRTLQISPRLHVLALNDLSCMMIFAPHPRPSPT